MKFHKTFNKSPNSKPASVISKLFISLFFLFFGGIGTFFFVFLLRDLLRGKAQWTMAFFLVIPLIFMLIGFGGLYGVWFGKEQNKPKAPKSKSGGKQLSPAGGILFGLIFIAAGLVVTWLLLVRPLVKTYQARSWLETPCKILSAEVQTHDSDDGFTYSVNIRYEYRFDNAVYHSTRYDFIGGSSSGYKGKKRIVDQYKSMPDPVCYVNPQNPSEAVLVRGLSLKNAIGLFPLIFVIAGIGIMVAAVKKKKRRALAWLPQNNTDPTNPARNEYAFASAPLDTAPDSIILHPDATPLGKMIGLLIFCLFWNGIVSIFVVEVVQGFRSGSPEWFLTLFMIPFVLVGIGVFIAVIYQLLALFNPKYTLTLQPAQLYPGSAGLIDWNVTGSAHRIQTLTLTLLGKEEARYTVGTDTKTDRKTFFEMELVNTDNHADIAAGQVGFVIPENTMHSFEADNNKLIWSIQVRGDIARWPDVKQDYKIIVSPNPVEKS